MLKRTSRGKDLHAVKAHRVGGRVKPMLDRDTLDNAQQQGRGDRQFGQGGGQTAKATGRTHGRGHGTVQPLGLIGHHAARCAGGLHGLSQGGGGGGVQLVTHRRGQPVQQPIRPGAQRVEHLNAHTSGGLVTAGKTLQLGFGSDGWRGKDQLCHRE